MEHGACALVMISVCAGLFSTIVAINHGTNLIWAQIPSVKVYSVSRLVAIQGDPNVWVANRKPQVTYISAPHFTWGFQAMGFHWEEQTLFWSEKMNKKIQSLVLNGSTETQTVFVGTSTEVYGIAVDWLSKNIYFTDALYNWIMLTSYAPDQPAYRIIVQDKLDSPHGLAVHPAKGYLFWSDWGERPKIEVADLLGQNRRILVDRNMVEPRGLSIDYQSNSLYWVDSFKGTVEMVQFNGNGRKHIHQEDGTSFYGVALFGDYIFVTERSRGMLKVFDQQNSVVSFTLGSNPYDIIMYDSSQQPGNSTDCDDLGCEQLCVLDPLTGPKCLCGEGYVGEDELNKSCKASIKFVHPSHIYAIRDSICNYPANIADMSLHNVSLDSQCFLEDKQGYMTLTFDARENMLYYFSNNSKTISRIPLEAGGKGKLVTGGTGVVKGMALDWVAGHLYWTDSSMGHIKVSSKSGAYQRVVLEDLNNPVGIAVHPGRGEIYWTDHGHLPDVGAKVEKAYMDGTGRVLIMGDNIGQPNHLFIDHEKNRLYWADSILHHIRSFDLVTGRISIVYMQDNVKFYGLSLFKDFLLWTDTEDLNGIHIARLDKQEKVRGIIHPRNGLASDLITFDIQNQPAINNSCSSDTFTCSQLCLLSLGNVSRCYCGFGYELSSDGFTCYTVPVMDNFLLVNDAYQKQIFQVNLRTAEVGVIGLNPSHEPIAVSFDPYEFKVFWSDNKANVIREATIDGRAERTVMFLNNVSMCDGLAVDYINKLLFFTDTGNDVIGVVSLRDYSLYAYVIRTGLDEPRDIAISPNEGTIYWTDWGTNARIEKASMDGSGREVVLQFEGKAWPNGLALDLGENKLYWVDAHADRISVMDLETGTSMPLIEEEDAHYFSVDVIAEYLYVADWKRNYVRRMNKRGGSLKQFGPANFTRLYGIKGFNSTESVKGVSVCVTSACEHLCLPRADKSFSCRCTEGYTQKGLQCFINNATTETLLTLPVPQTSPPYQASSSTTTTSGMSPTTSTSRDRTTEEEQGTTQQPAAISSSKPSVAMTTADNMGGETTESGEINTTIPPTTESGEINTTNQPVSESTSDLNSTDKGNNTVVAKSQSADSHGLAAAVVGVIVASIVIVVIIIVLITAYFVRRRRYVISHGKLVEEKNPADFYKIAFPARGEDTVTFDTGIENPTYDCLHDPSNNIMTNMDTPSS